MIPAGWRQEGHPATKTLLQFLFSLIWLSTKMGGVQPVVPHVRMRKNVTLIRGELNRSFNNNHPRQWALLRATDSLLWKPCCVIKASKVSNSKGTKAS